jgi:SsrA-binding protein
MNLHNKAAAPSTAMSKKKKSGNELVSNRKARHDYEILDTYEAGIVLTGTEIKSLRNHGGSLQEAYVKILKDEIWLVNAYIAPYSFGNIHNHPERRDRKLLLHRREIDKLKALTQEKGLALIPLGLFLNAKGYVKLKLGYGRGKKAVDKRQTIKDRDEKRRVQQAMKQGD